LFAADDQLPERSPVSASGEVAVQPMLGAQSVLDQVDTGVVVVDRQKRK